MVTKQLSVVNEKRKSSCNQHVNFYTETEEEYGFRKLRRRVQHGWTHYFCNSTRFSTEDQEGKNHK